MPNLNGGSKTFLYLIALATGKFVGAFQKYPHIETLEKAKPHPHFQRITVREQKEKAAIAAWVITL